MNKKCLIIDGNSLIYRAFYATLNQLEYYKQHNIVPVNALRLVLQIVLKLISEQSYEYVLFALDHQKKTQRHEVFADYKAGRKPMPEDLVIQLPLIKESLEAIGVYTMSIPGIEADDIIGSCAKLMNEQNVDVYIYSSDKDMLQLVNEHTIVNLFKTGISDIATVNLENFATHFHNLSPRQVIDFKGISGDSSDNLCGVRGIGPKTASELLQKFGTLENIYTNIESLSLGQKEKFLQAKELAIMCKSLSTIKNDVLENKDINVFINKAINKEKLHEIIAKYNFNSFQKYL